MICPSCKRQLYFLGRPNDLPATSFMAVCRCGHEWLTTVAEAGVEPPLLNPFPVVVVSGSMNQENSP
jgi:hypothetical protein